MKAVILAAGLGKRLEPYTHELPKAMVDVAGASLLDRMIGHVAAAGIDELIVVTGYLTEKVEAHLRASEKKLARDARIVFNEHYADWNNFYSLLVAEEATDGESFIRIDGDLLIGPSVLPRLLKGPGHLCLAIDCSVDLGEEEMKVQISDEGHVLQLNKRMNPADGAGEAIGVDRVDAEASAAVYDILREMLKNGDTDEYYERGYEMLMERGMEVGMVDVAGTGWNEIDTVEDLKHAEKLVLAGRAS